MIVSLIRASPFIRFFSLQVTRVPIEVDREELSGEKDNVSVSLILTGSIQNGELKHLCSSLVHGRLCMADMNASLRHREGKMKYYRTEDWIGVSGPVSPTRESE